MIISRNERISRFHNYNRKYIFPILKTFFKEILNQKKQHIILFTQNEFNTSLFFFGCWFFYGLWKFLQFFSYSYYNHTIFRKLVFLNLIYDINFLNFIYDIFFLSPFFFLSSFPYFFFLIYLNYRNIVWVRLQGIFSFLLWNIKRHRYCSEVWIKKYFLRITTFQKVESLFDFWYGISSFGKLFLFFKCISEVFFNNIDAVCDNKNTKK